MEKNKGGRPPKFKTPEELQNKFEDYMQDKEFDTYKSLSGLAVYCGTYRDYLTRTIEERPEFHDTIKGIKERLSHFCLNNAKEGDKNQALNIFLLKNNGYTDKTESEVTHKGNISIEKLFNDIDTNKK